MRTREIVIGVLLLCIGVVAGYFLRPHLSGTKPALTSSNTSELLELVPKDADFAGLMAVREPLGPAFTVLMGLESGSDDAKAFEADLRAFLLRHFGADLTRVKDMVGFLRVRDDAGAFVLRGEGISESRDQKTLGSGSDPLIALPQDSGVLFGNAAGIAMYESKAAITNDAPHKGVSAAVQLVGSGDLVLAAHLGAWQEEITKILPGTQLEAVAVGMDLLGGVKMGVTGPVESLKKVEESIRLGLSAGGLYVSNERLKERKPRMEEEFGLLMTDYLIRAVKNNLRFDYSGDTLTIRLENPNSSLEAAELASIPLVVGVLAATGAAAFERYLDASRAIGLEQYDYDPQAFPEE